MAAILAGGQARRFGGVDKGRIAVGGRSIRERQLEVLRSVADPVCLVGPRDRDGLPPGVLAIDDAVEGCGPLGGLDAALEVAGDATLLVLACDMPCVTAPFLEYLAGLAIEADVVVPRTERGYHPLCAAYSPACRPAVRRRLEARQLRMGDLLSDVRVRVVGPGEMARFGSGDYLLANVNTQAELDAIESFLSH
ncbi:MAG: molybdenum cofactor guanylyltransferase [Vicinamibacterales bacterium]